MSGIYISGVEMPQLYRTYKVRFAGAKDDKIVVGVAAEDSNAYVPVGEVVPVPPHGRLIDADKLRHKWRALKDGMWFKVIDVDDLDNAPTIIEADMESSQIACAATNCEHNVDGICTKGTTAAEEMEE